MLVRRKKGTMRIFAERELKKDFKKRQKRLTGVKLIALLINKCMFLTIIIQSPWYCPNPIQLVDTAGKFQRR